MIRPPPRIGAQAPLQERRAAWTYRWGSKLRFGCSTQMARRIVRGTLWSRACIWRSQRLAACARYTSPSSPKGVTAYDGRQPSATPSCSIRRAQSGYSGAKLSGPTR